MGCSTAAAAPDWVSVGTVDAVMNVFSPLSEHEPVIRPPSAAAGLMRRSGRWTEVDVDAAAQRLRTVRMPAELVGAQRLVAVDDIRRSTEPRPTIALGLWALYAHPIVRMGARFAGTRDGLTAEIALAVHPDRYIIIESDDRMGVASVITTADPIAAELIALALRQSSLRSTGSGPWEDSLVQAATELGLGVRNPDRIDIEAIISPTLSSERHDEATARIVDAAERIGVPANGARTVPESI